MKQSLQPGMSKTARIEIGLDRTIDFMGEEGRVYATPMLVRDIEQTCRGLLLEHADDVDDLVASLHDQSEGMMRSLQDALKEVQSACQGEEQKSWEMFQRIFLADQAIEPVAAEFGLSYHATAMRVQRMKKKVRSRALQLALQRGLTP